METSNPNIQQNPQKQHKPRGLCRQDGNCPNFPSCRFSHPIQIQMFRLQKEEQKNMNQWQPPHNLEQQPQQQHNYNFNTFSTNSQFNGLAQQSHTQMHSNQSQSSFGNQQNTNHPDSDQNQTPSQSSFQSGQNLQHQLNQPIQNNQITQQTQQNDRQPNHSGDNQRGRGGHNYRGRGRGKRGGGINKDSTNSKDIPCARGDSCVFNKQGKCRFKHQVIGDQDDDFVCPFGPACGDPACSKEHRRRQRSIDSNSVGGSSTRSKIAGLCRSDMVCENETCVYVHSTQSKKSPAFELRMMLNGVKDYGQISSGQSQESGKYRKITKNLQRPNSQIGGYDQYHDPGNYIPNPQQQYPPQVSALPNQFIGIGGQPFVVNQVLGIQHDFGSAGLNPMARQQIFTAGMTPPMSLQEEQLLIQQQILILQQQELQKENLDLLSIQGNYQPNSRPKKIPKKKKSKQKQENKKPEEQQQNKKPEEQQENKKTEEQQENKKTEEQQDNKKTEQQNKKPKQQQEVQNGDTFSYNCLEKISDQLCIKKSLEDIKSSNKALIEYEFTKKACKIKFNKDVEDWEKVKEQVSQVMPFSILYSFNKQNSDNCKEIIQQFIAKNKDKLIDRKVAIVSDEEYLKMKQQSKTNESKRKADKIVYFFGQKAKNEDVHYVKDLLKEFYKQEFSQNCSLFYGCKKMDISTRTHIYRFLKQSKQIDDILKNQGFTEKLEYDDIQHNIQVKLTHKNLEKIQSQLTALFDSVKTETMKINHNIVVHKTQLPNLQTLQKKVEEKFNVIINDTIQIFEDNKSSNTNAKNQGFDKKQPRWKYNNTPQERDTHMKKEYEIQVTGTETEKAINYINGILDDYLAIEPTLQYLKPNEFKELKDQAKAISLKFQVFILFRQKVHLVGRQSKNRLSDALQELQKAADNIQLGNKISTRAMQLTDAPNVILMKLMRAERSKVSFIESQNKVSIKIDRAYYIISGNDQGIAQATQDLTILEQTMLRKIVNLLITEQNRIKAIKMKGANIWEKESGVQIVCLTKEEAQLQQEKKHPSITNFNQQSLVEHFTYQWSYKVNNGDANYNDRHDKENDWFDYDLHQNSQIEQHYQQCCQQGNFQIVHQIIGDQNQQKNGFTYHVSGTSSDPSTWTEKNTQTGDARQLHRKELKFMGQQNNQVRPQQLYTDQIEEEKGGNYRSGGSQKNYYVKGLNEKVDSFLQQLDIFYQDPNNHTMILSLKNFKKIMNANILNQMKQTAYNKFNCNFAQGFNMDSIKIVGLNCFEAGKFFDNLLDKAKHFEFPNSWEQIDQHILEQNNLIIIPLAQGSHEWVNIENQQMGKIGRNSYALSWNKSDSTRNNL
eukprot:403373605